MRMHNPPHPGDFIRETYIKPFEISVCTLADNLGVPASTLNCVINRQSGVSPSMALRLSKAPGRSPESWIAMQYNFDLCKAGESTDFYCSSKDRS